MWFWSASFCHAAQAAGETLPGRKGEKELLLVGREKVPHGFGLTGDCSSHTADGAGSLNHGLLLPFPETRYPGLGTGRGKDCAYVGILEDFGILMKTLSHYSKSV